MMLKFKKYITAAICVALCLTFIGCGKTSESKPAEKVQEQQSEEAKDKAANDSGDKKESDTDKSSDGENSSSEAADENNDNVPDVSMEEFADMTDEFNNTDDPERKEELRKEIEKILNQMENASKSAE